jgi:hypothetical protein
MYICTVIPEKIDNIDVFKGDTYVCLIQDEGISL